MHVIHILQIERRVGALLSHNGRKRRCHARGRRHHLLCRDRRSRAGRHIHTANTRRLDGSYDRPRGRRHSANGALQVCGHVHCGTRCQGAPTWRPRRARSRGHHVDGAHACTSTSTRTRTGTSTQVRSSTSASASTVPTTIASGVGIFCRQQRMHHLEHVLIARVIADGEHEVRLRQLLQHLLHQGALPEVPHGATRHQSVSKSVHAHAPSARQHSYLVDRSK